MISDKVFCYTDDELLVPVCKTEKSAGYDIKAPEDIYVTRKLCEVRVDTGIVLDGSGIEEDFLVLLAPRSGLSDKLDIRLKNTVGLIDKDFVGPKDRMCAVIKMPFLLWLKHFVFRKPIFKRGDRICQISFIMIMKPDIVRRPSQENKNDDRGGFGSTGIR